MEQSEHEPAPAEREPQVSDVVMAMRHLIVELAPDADAEDVEVAIAELEDAVDLEEALGIAGGAFAMLGVDYDEGLGRLGEILQVEAILPNGDQAQASED
jgi:hypothetical protein